MPSAPLVVPSTRVGCRRTATETGHIAPADSRDGSVARAFYTFFVPVLGACSHHGFSLLYSDGFAPIASLNLPAA
jgi:hypothetical protein